MDSQKYKMIFFDMDGVLVNVGYEEKRTKVGVGSWRSIYHELNLLEEDEKLKQRFEDGEFPSYVEWTHEACKLFQKENLTQEQFLKIINSQHIMTGAKETVSTLKENGFKTAVITGGFRVLAERVVSELGIDDFVAHCDFKFNKEGELESWEINPCDYEGKVDAFLELAKKYNVEPSECVYVGDEVNDIPIFNKAGLSIAFNSKRAPVKEAADIVVDGKDLREILQPVLDLNRNRN